MNMRQITVAVIIVGIIIAIAIISLPFITLYIKYNENYIYLIERNLVNRVIYAQGALIVLLVILTIMLIATIYANRRVERELREYMKAHGLKDFEARLVAYHPQYAYQKMLEEFFKRSFTKLYNSLERVPEKERVEIEPMPSSPWLFFEAVWDQINRFFERAERERKRYRVYECPICSTVFSNEKELFAHLEKEHKVEVVKNG